MFHFFWHCICRSYSGFGSFTHSRLVEVHNRRVFWASNNRPLEVSKASVICQPVRHRSGRASLWSRRSCAQLIDGLLTSQRLANIGAGDSQNLLITKTKLTMIDVPRCCTPHRNHAWLAQKWVAVCISFASRQSDKGCAVGWLIVPCDCFFCTPASCINLVNNRMIQYFTLLLLY